MSEADSTERNLRMKFEIRCADWKFVKIPSALIGNTSITDGAKVTYGALVVWGRETGKAWPSRKLLSAARGLKERTLRSHLSELERAGWVTRLVTESRTIVTLHKESIYQGGGITIPEGRHYDSGGGGITIPEGRQQIATEVEDRSRNHKNKSVGKEPTNYREDLFEEGWRYHKRKAKPGNKRTDGNCGWRQWRAQINHGKWSAEEILSRWKRRVDAHGPNGFALPHVQRVLRPGNNMLSDESIADCKDPVDEEFVPSREYFFGNGK